MLAGFLTMRECGIVTAMSMVLRRTSGRDDDDDDASAAIYYYNTIHTNMHPSISRSYCNNILLLLTLQVHFPVHESARQPGMMGLHRGVRARDLMA